MIPDQHLADCDAFEWPVEAVDSSNPAYTYILNDLEVEFWRALTYGT